MRRPFRLSKVFFILLCVIWSGLSAETAKKIRILVGSPVRQKPAILKEFLSSLNHLKETGFTLDYCFVDDNVQSPSRDLLLEFAKEKGSRCTIVTAPDTASSPRYLCTENTHHWEAASMWRVAAFKDRIIRKAQEEEYDYLFLIDSDLVLHPKTLEQLLGANKEVLSNIFWTRWQAEEREPLPNVWLSDFYAFFAAAPGEKPAPEEKNRLSSAFLAELKKPGVYEVGGLGACTLISKAALKKGVCFQKLRNLSIPGEDSHFCIRATALGLSLFVDTHFPAYHIYRESELSGVSDFLQSCGIETSKEVKPARITLSMIVRNEAGRYLRRVLEEAKKVISDAVIIDDASSDTTVTVCEEALKGIPLTIVKNPHSLFSNEWLLRKEQWEETVKRNPEWILMLDADEIFEEKFKDEVQKLLADRTVDVWCFRLYDFWDNAHFRDDKWWNAHVRYSPFLVRYDPDKTYHWLQQPQHCGRFPHTINLLPRKISDLRVKHYGWAKKEDREAKYRRYKELDPEERFGVKEQVDSILDESPRLTAWVE